LTGTCGTKASTHRRSLLGATLAATAPAASAAPGAAAESAAPESLDALLRPSLALGLPVMPAAVAINDTVTAAGEVGTRRAGTDIP